jgi:Phosphoheptose isomerase
MNELIEKIKKARFVWVCGNGGSASTAEHFTNDLFKKGIKAICLNSNVAIMTMISNDFGYSKIFMKQLAVYGDKRDMLITISCSGISPNIIEAHEIALAMDMVVYEFQTFNDEYPDYGSLEDKHLKFAHEVAEKL